MGRAVPCQGSMDRHRRSHAGAMRPSPVAARRAGIGAPTGQAPDPALLSEEAAQVVQVRRVNPFPGQQGASRRGAGVIAGAGGTGP